MSHHTSQGDKQEFEALLEEFDTALFTTRGPDGHFHTRPMAMQKKGLSAEEMWFVTSDESHKVAELEADAHCSIALYKGGHSATYLSISGTAELVHDRETIRRMWAPDWKLWFPDGPETRDIVLLRFRPEHAEYVHPKTGKLKVLFTIVKNVITHERSDPAPRKELDLNGNPASH